MTTTEFFSEWLSDERLELERSTYEAYTIYFNKHIIPYFDSVGDLKNLTARHIKNYVNYKRTDGRCDGKQGGLSDVTVKKHLSLIKQALNEAVVLGYISANPSLSVRLKRSTKAIADRTVLLTPEEGEKIIKAFDGHPLRACVVLALVYGLRRSEVLGLKWSAIDFEHDALHIEHTVVKGLTIEAKDRTKTASSRASFDLFPNIKKMLLELYEKRPKNSEYINAREDGTVFRPDYVTRGFQRVLKNNGFRQMRFHDLRHSTASILFDRGVSIEEVKIWLRHDDIETTMNIYVHYSRRRKKLVSNAVSEIFQK